jgi:acetyltransferase
MPIRDLDALLSPKSIALIGASDKPGSIGAILAQNLLDGGLRGEVMLVNPNYRKIRDRDVYPDVASLPYAVDLGIICTPAEAVPGIVGALGKLGARAALIISAGFGEGRDVRGAQLQKALTEAIGSSRLRIMGPNCLGLLVPGIGLNASFAHRMAKGGALAFVAQSGAIVTSVLDWADARGIGFSHLISLGDMIDVDFDDTLDYLANDAGTRAILLYIESIKDARRFMSAARAASRMKPVILVKAGRHAEGARAVESHTGALAGADAVYDAAFERAGVLRVRSLEELFDAVETLALAKPPRGDRLAILTNGGGIGILATDALIDQGGRLAHLSEETISALSRVLPLTWSHANPVDIIGDATGKRYADALTLLTRDPGVDGILVLNCPTAVTSSDEAAAAVVACELGPQRHPLLTSWVGETAAQGARNLFAERRIPTYDTPEQAVRAFMYLVRYRRSQDLLMETPPSVPVDFQPDTERARGIVAGAVAQGGRWLTEYEAKQLMSAYGIPVVATHRAESPEQAAEQAALIGGAVALKILSPDITHKSDVGGVVLDLEGPAAVLDAAKSMRERLGRTYPQARFEGFTVQPVVRRPGAYELIVGMSTDPQFGPVILAGQGGIAVEVLDDKALGLPPLNMRLAGELLARTRIYRLLKGFRGQPAANLEAIALTLVRLSQLVVDLAEICELDINPLLADQFGVMALDARVRVEATDKFGADRLAIRPYPRELEELVPLGDGRILLLRPIRPEDEPSLQAAFAKLTPEEVRLRFFVPMKTLSHVTAARFTQIDYDREMALILTDAGIAGRTQIYGVVRIIADPDNETAEYAVIVRHDMTGMGLGVFLMRRILDYAQRRGIREIQGDVLQENRTMLKLCEVLGFERRRSADDPEIVLVSLRFPSGEPSA